MGTAARHRTPVEPKRRETLKRHHARIYDLDTLRAPFPNGTLSRFGRGANTEYRLFIPNAPDADTCLYWDCWAAGAYLEHRGTVGRLSFGWGCETAEGWEPV